MFLKSPILSGHDITLYNSQVASE